MGPLAHHLPGGAGFRNPWPSYIERSPIEYLTGVAPEQRRLVPRQLPVVPPEWPRVRAPAEALQALHVSHATFLFQAYGWNMLTDPVFSARASPVQGAGPERYTPSPCALEELPPVHVALLSHNHYDHIDVASITALLRKEAADLARARADLKPDNSGTVSPYATRAFAGTLFVCPLKVAPLLVSLGVRRERIAELDWWESLTPAVLANGALDPIAANGVRAAAAGPAGGVPSPAPRIVCTPAQHQSARTLFDRNEALWCSFTVVTRRVDAAPAPAPSSVTFFFSGDTGYRSVPRGAAPYSRAETAGPVCPAFKEVGDALGPVDLAVLPLGAYSPRWFMSSFHASPEDAVDMHKDLRARRSVGMHWGVFPLTDEPVDEPPLRLAIARRLAGIADDAFVAVKPGALVGATTPVAAADCAAVDAAAIDEGVVAARAAMAADTAPKSALAAGGAAVA